MSNMIVCPEPLAAEAGKEVFGAGGNAMDAAIAAAFVQAVVNPMSCGVGGSGLLHHYDGPSGESTIVNGRASIGSRPIPDHWTTHAGGRTETVGRYLVRDHANNMGYQAIMTPGFVRGCWVAYQRFGSGQLSWSELLSAAARIARNGFELSEYDARHWGGRVAGSASPGVPDTLAVLNATPEARRIYLKDGEPLRAGDRLTQQDLANTIQRLADAGAEDFYVGEIADAISHDLAEHDGFVTAEDLRDYAVGIHEPVRGSYRGHTVVAPPYGSGPQTVEMLQTLEHFDLAGLGHNSTEYIDTVARVQRATFADCVQLKGRSFEDEARLVSEVIKSERAAHWAERIKGGDRVDVASGSGLAGTTHLTCVGDDLSIVGFTHSIGNGAGAGVVTPGLGFLYNNFLGHFNPRPGFPDSIEPRKKTSGGPPTVVLKDGQPYIALGAPGGSRLITSISQVLVNVLDHGMDMETAVTVPRFHSEQDQLVFLEPDIPEHVADGLRACSNEITRSTYMSRVQAIRIRSEDRELEAGPDPRGGQGVGVNR